MPMDLNEVKALLEYHYWARDRMLDAVAVLSSENYRKDLANSFASIRDTVVHIYSAERIWCSRWLEEPPHGMLDPTKFPEVADVRAAWVEHEPRLAGLIDRLRERGMDREIEYHGPDGRKWKQPFIHMFQHLVNHSSYHRGQVTTMLRQLGAQPPKSTDLIAFYRLKINA